MHLSRQSLDSARMTAITSPPGAHGHQVLNRLLAFGQLIEVQASSCTPLSPSRSPAPRSYARLLVNSYPSHCTLPSLQNRARSGRPRNCKRFFANQAHAPPGVN